MLNRRTLRIKAMQTLYALRQSRNANYGIALDHIKVSFQPDLNSMEVQDPVHLKTLQKEALQIFEKNYGVNGFESVGASDPEIDEVVTESIQTYHEANKNDRLRYRKQMQEEVDRIYDRYLSVLLLISEFQQVAISDSKRNHANFIKNPFVKELAENEELAVVFSRNHISWEKDMSDVRQWFKEHIREDEKYLEYVNLESTTHESDLEFVQYLIKTLIFKNEVINAFLEERDLNWSEDKAIVKSLTAKTVKAFAQDGELELQDMSYNWEDDKQFFVELYDETCKVEKEYEELIAQKTRNWDIDRIAMTDRIAIEMAIAEMIRFSSIPVKVTINEYIELVKKYSTPKSKQFINGVLDVLSNELLENGTIRKSGRGLIDNK